MTNKVLIGLALLGLAVLGGVGIWYYQQPRPVSPPPAPAAESPPAAPSPAPPAAILHPLPEGAGSAARPPLPALADSDAAILGALDEVAGAAAVADYVVRENVIRRIVATVDNLPRQRIPVERRPVAAVPGPFRVTGDEVHATLDPLNYARYRPLVGVIRNLDMQRLVNVYVRFYPLFQRAYEDLGYPDAYFNDRVVAVIDLLLSTPQPAGSIDLVRPNVMYEFADPDLEARPAGQKLLIRMGPDNAGAVKAKLMELRAGLTAAPLKR